MHIDRAAIERMLPHRDPILLLQSVWVDRPGEAGRSLARLPAAVPMLGAHDGRSLAQELALEAAAQTLGVVIGSASGPDTGADERHLLLGFDQVGFDTAFPLPVQSIEVRVEREEASAAVCSARFWVTADGVGFADGRVMVMKGVA